VAAFDVLLSVDAGQMIYLSANCVPLMQGQTFPESVSKLAVRSWQRNVECDKRTRNSGNRGRVKREIAETGNMGQTRY